MTICFPKRILRSQATRTGTRTSLMTSSSRGVALIHFLPRNGSIALPHNVWYRTTVSQNGVGFKPIPTRAIVGSEWKPYSTRVSNSHRWQTHAHALIEHPNIMIESIKGSDLDFDFVPRPVHNELFSPCPFCLLHSQLLRPDSLVASHVLISPHE
jgi:hypothetical protein